MSWQRNSVLGGSVVALAAPVITYYEGFRLDVYRDPIGIVTECIGHTKTAAQTVGRNSVVSCAQKLKLDIESHWYGIQGCAAGVTPISEEEWAAYLSFAFNVGVGNFCKSQLAVKLKAGDRMGACAELSKWTKAGGKDLPGLVRRRATERELCEIGAQRPASTGAIG